MTTLEPTVTAPPFGMNVGDPHRGSMETPLLLVELAPQSVRPGPLVWQLAVLAEPEPPLLLLPELDPDALQLPLLPLPVPCVTVKVAKAMVESVHTPG